MAASWWSVWLTVASSLVSQSQGQAQVYNVGDEARVPCQQVDQGTIYRVNFYKAGIPTKIYW